MTRINLVDPTELMDQHLLAEYREIRLLCANLQRTLRSKRGFQQNKVPEYFTLNKGHVYFFDKGQYLHKRYNTLRAELQRRGMRANLDFPVDIWPPYLYNDWEPSERDRNVVRERIALRISQRTNWYRYYGVIQ